MNRESTPALIMLPLALLAGTALLLDCFRTDLPGLTTGVSGVSGAPTLWIAVAATVVLAGAALRILVRDRRGGSVEPGQLWSVAGIAIVGFAVVFTALMGWSTGQLVAEGVPDAPRVDLVADRLLFLAAGSLAAIASSAFGWLRHLTDAAEASGTR